MMAELVQGQASMNQPGLKSDGLADVLQRARQVTTAQGKGTHSAPGHPALLDQAKALFFEFTRVVLLLLRTYALRQHTHTHAHARTHASLLTSSDSGPERDLRPGLDTRLGLTRSGS